MTRPRRRWALHVAAAAAAAIALGAWWTFGALAAFRGPWVVWARFSTSAGPPDVRDAPDGAPVGGSWVWVWVWRRYGRGCDAGPGEFAIVAQRSRWVALLEARGLVDPDPAPYGWIGPEAIRRSADGTAWGAYVARAPFGAWVPGTLDARCAGAWTFDFGPDGAFACVLTPDGTIDGTDGRGRWAVVGDAMVLCDRDSRIPDLVETAVLSEDRRTCRGASLLYRPFVGRRADAR